LRLAVSDFHRDSSTANSSALVLAGSVSQPEISQELSSAVAKSWRGEKVENLTAAIHDGKEETYIVLTPGKEVAEIGVGLEWNSPVKVDGLEVHYATLNGTAYEPLPTFKSCSIGMEISGARWLNRSHRLSAGRETGCLSRERLGELELSIQTCRGARNPTPTQQDAFPVRLAAEYVIRNSSRFFRRKAVKIVPESQS